MSTKETETESVDEYVIFFMASYPNGGRWNAGTTGADSARTVEAAEQKMAERFAEFRGRPWVTRIHISVVQASTNKPVNTVTWERPGT